MAWQRRIKQAAYTSPSGVRVTFQYTNVSRSVNKKTTNFEFPDADGSFVQDLGRDGRKYPIRAFFSGDDYDRDADQFETVLLERGRGRLEHPLYGSFTVVPFGAITRRDDLVTAANQAVIEVTFWETIELVYPQPLTDDVSAVQTGLAAYIAAAGAEFADLLDVSTVADEAGFLATFQQVTATVGEILDTTTDVYQDIEQSINRSIDILVRDPLTLANQFVQLVQAPARGLESITARLDAYGNLARSLTGFDPQDSTTATANDFATTDLAATAAVSGSVVAVTVTPFDTQPAAIEAADALTRQLDTVVNWREVTFNEIETVTDTGASYQGLQRAVALAANYLIEISFTLLQERRVVLSHPRTIIDLAGELYGRVDDNTLNFLINTNQLTGSEILELPRGRAVVYYV